jgi:hypothetical protein
MQRKIGIDVGRVIIDSANEHTDKSFFGENFLKSTAVPEAFWSIAELCDHFKGEAYIVSKCGALIQKKTREWFRYHNFHVLTGLRPEHMHFCRERSDKAIICAELGITDFIDDRLEVLGYLLHPVQHRILFQGREREIAKHKQHLPSVIQLDSWAEVRKYYGR